MQEENIGPAEHDEIERLLWHVTVTIPGPPFGDAKSIDEAKARFKAAWIAFEDKGRSRGAGCGLCRDEPRQPTRAVPAVIKRSEGREVHVPITLRCHLLTRCGQRTTQIGRCAAVPAHVLF
jgi:hypothetical protein